MVNVMLLIEIKLNSTIIRDQGFIRTLYASSLYLNFVFHYVHFSAQVNKNRKCHQMCKKFLTEFLFQGRISFILASRTFQIVGPCRNSNYLGPNVIVLVLECIAVLMLQIATVSGRTSTRLRYSQSPGREIPNRSSIGTSKWRS